MSAITGTPSIGQAEAADVGVGGRHLAPEAKAGRSAEAAPSAAAQDVVQISETGRTLSRLSLDDREPEIQLSPDKLRAMVTPKQDPNAPAAVDAPRE